MGLLKCCMDCFCNVFLFITAYPMLLALHSYLLTPIPQAPPAPCLWHMETELEFLTASITAPLPKGDHSPVLSRKDTQVFSPQALWPSAPCWRVIHATWLARVTNYSGSEGSLAGVRCSWVSWLQNPASGSSVTLAGFGMSINPLPNHGTALTRGRALGGCLLLQPIKAEQSSKYP